MPRLQGRDNNASDKGRRPPQARRAESEQQTSLNPSNDREENQFPGNDALGSDFSQATFEKHAAMLGDRRMSQPMYARQRADAVLQLQRDYGNSYVQRLVSHISEKQDPTANTHEITHMDGNNSNSLAQLWPGGASKHLKDRALERGITEKETEDTVKNGVQYDDPDYPGGTVYYDTSTGVTVGEAPNGTKTTCYKSARPKSRWTKR